MVFIITSIIIALGIFILMPKKISYIEMYTASLFSIVFQLLTDILLEFNYNLYGYFNEGVEYRTLWIVFGIYPLFTIIFLSYFPYDKRKSVQVGYIVAWTIFALVYEYISVQVGAFYYNSWKLLYSALTYPIVYLVIYYNFIIIRKLLLLYKEKNV
ncbi:CBO0543 family protein [Ornithinibacillus sp. JPR2-1]|uniref:CBO0543 family protein n=1 Tax=Ornithinibacillus sp. JPR2-1 TaxID=2094019 RepID=UPI0031CF3FF2